QHQCWRPEPGELLGLDLAADPPVGVVLRAETRDGLAGTGQVVELAAPDRLLDRRLDARRAVERTRAPRRARLLVGCRGLTGIPILAVSRRGQPWIVVAHGRSPESDSTPARRRRRSRAKSCARGPDPSARAESASTTRVSVMTGS